MLTTDDQIAEHVHEETDIASDMTDLRCSLDCIDDSETLEDSRANVVESIKSVKSILSALQSTLALIDG